MHSKASDRGTYDASPSSESSEHRNGGGRVAHCWQATLREVTVASSMEAMSGDSRKEPLRCQSSLELSVY